MEIYKVKNNHSCFNDKLLLSLNEENGEKIIRFIDLENKEKDHIFDPTNPEDIKTLYKFTGFGANIYCLEDDSTINQTNKMLTMKWNPILILRDYKLTEEEEQKRDKDYYQLFENFIIKRNNIRKWLYSYPLKPIIKMVSIYTCGCNMGHCDAITDIEIDETEYKTLGELFALFTGKNIPCYASYLPISENAEYVIKDDPYYEHPDSVQLYIEKCDKNKTFEVYKEGTCYSKTTRQVKLNENNEENTLMSWYYSR